MKFRIKHLIVSLLVLMTLGFLSLPVLQTAHGAAMSQSVNSTAYCNQAKMADGNYTHDGVVAMNNIPFHTKFIILSGPLTGKEVKVEDHMALGANSISGWTPVVPPGNMADIRS